MRQIYQIEIHKNASSGNRNFFGDVRKLSGDPKLTQSSLSEANLENFYNFFSKIGEKLASNFDSVLITSTSKLSLRSIFLCKTTTSELTKTLSQLKNKYSFDAFNLNNYFLNSIASSIAPLLCEILNKCMELGYNPECLKIAKIIPVFKDGGTTEPSNYRPISILPAIEKVFENSRKLYTAELFLS